MLRAVRKNYSRDNFLYLGFSEDPVVSEKGAAADQGVKNNC
jgi:hypothetical protein